MRVGAGVGVSVCDKNDTDSDGRMTHKKLLCAAEAVRPNNVAMEFVCVCVQSSSRCQI